MRDCKRNQRDIWYAAYLGTAERVVNGVRTGQNDPQYADPVHERAAVASFRGEADVEMFGSDIQYSCTMTSVRRLPIDEYALVWIGKSPADGAANYVVKRAAFGLNQHVWALAKVTGT